MPGELFHAKTFRTVRYLGSDGCEHDEIDGDFETVSNTSWAEVMTYYERLGVPRDAWPIFDDPIDVPMAEVVSMNRVLTTLFRALPEPRDAPHWAELVWRSLRVGELVFFCVS